MKSFLAAGAILTLSLCCAPAEADFPASIFGPQAPNWGAQVPAYGTQAYAVPNANAAQPYSPTAPFYGQSGQAAPTYQPAAQYMASVPQPSAPRNALMAAAPNGHAAGHGTGVLNPPEFNSGSTYTAPGHVPSGPAATYGNGANSYEQAMGAPSWCCPAPAAKGCPTWFGGVYGLIMTRDGEEDFYLFTSDSDPSRLYCPSSDFATDYTGGTEVRFGRTFACCKWGLEFVYWGLNPNSASAVINTVDVPGTMRSTVDYYNVWSDFPPPADITAVTDNITYANIRRREQYYNFEVNLLSGPLTLAPSSCCDPCGSGYGLGGACGTGACGYTPGCGIGNRGCCGPRWAANWAFGFRYFKFDEALNIFMDRDDNAFYSTDYEIFHDIDVENNLVGAQLGIDMNYCLTNCLQLDFGSKFGIYGNHATQFQKICNTTSLAYVLPSAPEDFWVSSEEDDVAFMGELRVGLGYKVGCHCRFTGGYRAIAASGVATTIGQLRHGRTLGSLWNVADIDTDDSLVLHGAYVGTEFAW